MHQSRLPLSEMFRFGVVGVGNTLLNFTTFALVASRLSSLGKGGLTLANRMTSVRTDHRSPARERDMQWLGGAGYWSPDCEF